MNEPYYVAKLHPTPMSTTGKECWVVEGPGMFGLSGTLPEASQKMPQRDARRLADMLNLAHWEGRRGVQRELRTALGIVDSDSKLFLDTSCPN